ncbi:hypothetical protein D3C83_243690 [compost metagenome]
MHAVFADFQTAFDKNRIVGAEQLGAFLVGIRPGDDFDKPGFVLEIEIAIAITLFSIAQF